MTNFLYSFIPQPGRTEDQAGTITQKMNGKFARERWEGLSLTINHDLYHLNNRGYFGARKFYLRVIPK
jgi:hypothetical protein